MFQGDVMGRADLKVSTYVIWLGTRILVTFCVSAGELLEHTASAAQHSRLGSVQMRTVASIREGQIVRSRAVRGHGSIGLNPAWASVL